MYLYFLEQLTNCTFRKNCTIEISFIKSLVSNLAVSRTLLNVTFCLVVMSVEVLEAQQQLDRARENLRSVEEGIKKTTTSTMRFVFVCLCVVYHEVCVFVLYWILLIHLSTVRSVCLFVLWLDLSVCHDVCLSRSVRLYVRLFVYHDVCLSVCLHIMMCVCIDLYVYII